MTEAAVLYVPDLARMIGRTESAIRAGVQRGVDWVPPAFNMGRRLAWRREDVDAWLANRALPRSKKT
jgi:predicted DNA-binding transcriptional regulator AlpA